MPLEDEIEALKIADQQIADGEVYKLDEIDWDNLDDMDLE